MLKKLGLLYLCLMVLASCSNNISTSQEKRIPSKDNSIQYKKPVPEEFLPRPLHIVAAGDSLTQGVGDSTEQGGYLPYLARMLDKEGIRQVEIENYGVKGNRTDQLLKRLDSEELKNAVGKADLVAITIGGNDMMRIIQKNIFGLDMPVFENAQEGYVSRIKEVLETVTSLNEDAIIVLVGFYNPFFPWFSDIIEMNEIVTEWNQASSVVTEQYPNAVFVEIDDLFLNLEENLLFEDYFHPNDKGYELIAERVFEQLRGERLKELETRTYTVRNEESNNE
jgi:lysophospholipase L1-like esterase